MKARRHHSGDFSSAALCCMWPIARRSDPECSASSAREMSGTRKASGDQRAGRSPDDDLMYAGLGLLMAASMPQRVEAGHASRQLDSSCPGSSGELLPPGARFRRRGDSGCRHVQPGFGPQPACRQPRCVIFVGSRGTRAGDLSTRDLAWATVITIIGASTSSFASNGDQGINRVGARFSVSRCWRQPMCGMLDPPRNRPERCGLAWLPGSVITCCC